MNYTCPYCDKTHTEANAACCGEVGHMQDPANIALTLYKRLHRIHQQQNPNHALIQEVGDVCDKLLELAAILQGGK